MQPKPSSKYWQLLRPLGAAVLIGSFLLYLIVVLSQAQHENRFSNASLKDLRAVHAKHPDDDGIAYELAHSLERDNQNDEARLTMQKLVQRQPQNLTYWQGLARCASDSGHAMEALEAYKQSEKLDPTWAAGHFKRAEILVSAGLMREALPEYDLGAKLDPASVTNTEPWIRCLMAAGRNAEAWDRLIAMTKKTMVSDPCYELLTDLAIRLNRPDPANKLLEDRIRSVPLYPTGKYRICELRLMLSEHLDTEMLRDAEQVALNVAQGTEPSADYFAMLGRIRVLRGSLSDAASALISGLKLDRDNRACLETLADVYKRMGKSAQEQQVWNHIRKVTGETPELAQLRRGAQQSPQDTAALLALAKGLEDAGKFGEAADTYEGVLTLRPQDPTAAAQREAMRRKALELLDQNSRKIVAEMPAQ